jgi:hypothetical protein
MKRDDKKVTPADKKRLLKMERTTIQQLDDQELERVNGGLHSHCRPTCN